MTAFEDKNLVFFDLETTGLYHTDPDILQISAIRGDCGDSFDKFVDPNRKKRTDPSVEKINNLQYDPNTSSLYKIVSLYGEGERRLCQTDSPKQILTQFVIWLHNLFESSGSKKVILIAYNAFSFDALILMKKLKENTLNDFFAQVCYGFADPLVLARDKYSNFPSRKMEYMLKHFNLLHEHNEQSHNAIMDAYDLRRLTFKFKEEDSSGIRNITVWEMLKKYSKTVEEIELMI